MGYQSADDYTIATLRTENAELRQQLDRMTSYRDRQQATVEILERDLERATTERAHALGSLDALRSFVTEMFTDLVEHANEMKAEVQKHSTMSTTALDPAIREAFASGAETVLEADARMYTRLQSAINAVGK